MEQQMLDHFRTFIMMKAISGATTVSIEDLYALELELRVWIS